MLEIIFIAMVVIAILTFGLKKTKLFVKKSLDTVVEVGNSIVKKDPMTKLKDQVNAYKIKLAELFANTISLTSEKNNQITRRDRAQAVADAAKEKGNRGDALEAFTMVKSAEDSIESLKADIAANDELYETMVKSLSGRQLQLSKFESSSKRREMRSAANTIRRDIAKDEMLEEGLFSPDLGEECPEEIEAIAIEKVNSDLKGGDVLDRYESKDDQNEEFEKFFTKTDG